MPSPCVETSPGLEIARACEQKMAAPPMVCPIRTRPLAREGARDHTDRAVGGMYSTNPLVGLLEVDGTSSRRRELRPRYI